MKITLAYVNQIGVSCIMNMSSVMNAVKTMDEFIKSNRVNIVISESGEPEDIQACVIAQSAGKRLVYTPNPAKYTEVLTQATFVPCVAHVYEVKIKTGRRVYCKTTNDSMEAATIYVHGLRAGYPVFLNRDGQIVAADNCGPKWASYSIHASSGHSNPTPAPKAGVAPMPEPETPDIDIDAALDEMNDAVGDFDDNLI